MISSKRLEKRNLQDIYDQLLRQLKDTKALVRANAVEKLAKIDHPSVVSRLVDALSDSNPLVRWSAALVLGEREEKEAVGPLISELSDHFSEVRMYAAEALGILLQDEEKCPPALIKNLKDPDELVRIEVAESIGAIGDQKALPALWKVIHDRSPLVRSYVAVAIGRLGSRADITRLEREMRNEKNDTVKIGYYQALYILGKHEILPAILKLLESRDYRVRCATARTLCSDFIVDRSNVQVILDTLQKAFKRETSVAIAPKSSIQSSIREIKQRFPGK